MVNRSSKGLATATAAISGVLFLMGALEWGQTHKLMASDAGGMAYLGSSVSVSGETVLVGAPGDTPLGAWSGSAYVFVRSAAAWSEQAKLTASDGAGDDHFGHALSVSGDTAVIGARQHDLPFGDCGAAYVFFRQGGTWSEQGKLSASDAAVGDRLGQAADVDGDTAIVGGPENDDAGESSGAAYVFARTGTTWMEQAKLTASDASGWHFFGSAVAVSGDDVAVGSHGYDVPSPSSGAVYVFARTGTTWTEQAKLTPSGSPAGAKVGFAVSIDGQTIVAGAPSDPDAGAAYVFVRDGTTWTEQAKLVGSDAAAGDDFGHAVAVRQDVILVGAPEGDGAGLDAGAVYVFTRSAAVWTEQDKLTASDPNDSDWFGHSLGLGADTAVLGAPGDDEAVGNAGAAYVFLFALDGDSPCGTDTECLSGFCVDGVCCNSPCGDGALDDCQACSVAAGSSTDGICEPLAAGTECRSSAGVCDAPEQCDGQAVHCPTDEPAPNGTSCDDGDECTDGDSCTDGTCQPGQDICGNGGGSVGGGNVGGGSAAGGPGGTGSGAGNAAHPGGDPGADSGCGCRLHSERSDLPTTGWLWAAALLLWVRRRCCLPARPRRCDGRSPLPR